MRHHDRIRFIGIERAGKTVTKPQLLFEKFDLAQIAAGSVRSDRFMMSALPPKAEIRVRRTGSRLKILTPPAVTREAKEDWGR
jgi:hypothetical protein